MRKFFLAALLALTSSFAFAQQTTPTSIPGCVYNSTLPTLTNRQITPLQCDVNGKLIISGGGGATAVTSAAVIPAGKIVIGDDGARGVKGSKVTLTDPTTIATLTLADNSSLITVGAFASTLTFTGTTGVTFPTSGTLATTSQLASLPLSGANGGTGVANTGFTITLAGNLVTTGAFNTTFIQQSTRNFTLPNADGTFATLAGTENLSNKTIASPALSGTVTGSNTIPLTILAQSAPNTMLGNWTSSTANVVANTIPSCPDTGTNHLNYVSGTGITCGTAGSSYAGVTTGGTGQLVFAQGAITTSSQPFVSHTATWNDGAVVFENFVSNITTTARAVNSTLFDFKTGGTSRFKAIWDGAGYVIRSPYYYDAAIGYYIADGINGFWSSGNFTQIASSNYCWVNSSNANSGTIDLCISRSAAGIVRVGTTFNNSLGSLYATIVKVGGFTVATLPTAGTAGRFAYVTDQLTVCAAAGAALTGGGAVVCPVFDNGVAWVGG